LISLKEGYGVSRRADGRSFYLWPDKALGYIFQKQALHILAFNRDVSKVNERDTWLSYILQKNKEFREILFL